MQTLANIKMVLNNFIKTPLILSLLLISGCGSQIGIKIRDLASQKEISIESEGFREIIINTNNNEERFHTLQRNNNKLLFKTYDLNGNQLTKSTTLPLYFRNYCDKTNFAISPDGLKFLHFSPPTNSINISELETGKEKIVLNQASSSGYSIKKIKWVNNDLAIVVLDEDLGVERKEKKIVSINNKTGKSHDIAFPSVLPNYGYALSYSNKYLAYPAGLIASKIDILDLEKGSFLPPIVSEFSYITNPTWSFDDKKIAFTENGNEVKIYIIGERNYISLIKFPGKIVYKLHFINQNELYAVIGTLNEYSKQYVSINTQSRVSKRYSHIDLNGDIYFLKNGRIAIYEHGY